MEPFAAFAHEQARFHAKFEMEHLQRVMKVHYCRQAYEAAKPPADFEGFMKHSVQHEQESESQLFLAEATLKNELDAFRNATRAKHHEARKIREDALKFLVNVFVDAVNKKEVIQGWLKIGGHDTITYSRVTFYNFTEVKNWQGMYHVHGLMRNASSPFERNLSWCHVRSLQFIPMVAGVTEEVIRAFQQPLDIVHFH